MVGFGSFVKSSEWLWLGKTKLRVRMWHSNSASSMRWWGAVLFPGGSQPSFFWQEVFVCCVSCSFCTILCWRSGYLIKSNCFSLLFLNFFLYKCVHSVSNLAGCLLAPCAGHQACQGSAGNSVHRWDAMGKAGRYRQILYLDLSFAHQFWESFVLCDKKGSTI